MTTPAPSECLDSSDPSESADQRNPWIVGMFTTSVALIAFALVVDLISLLGLVRPTAGYAFVAVYGAIGPISTYCWTVGTVLALSAAVISAIRWRSS